MTILRAIAAIIVGYLVFAASSMLLVGLVIARQGPLVVVIALVAIATIANLVMGFGAEPVWYKVGTLVLTALAVLLVGLRWISETKTG